MTEIIVGLVQMCCPKGAIAHNISQIKQYANEAVAQKADFLVLPEMSITGYIDPTRQPEACLSLDSTEVAEVAYLTAGKLVTGSFSSVLLTSSSSASSASQT